MSGRLGCKRGPQTIGASDSALPPGFQDGALIRHSEQSRPHCRCEPDRHISLDPKGRSEGHWLRKKNAHWAALVSGPLEYECLCRCCTSPVFITPDERFAEYVDQFPSLCAKSVQHSATLHFGAPIKTPRASHFGITEQLFIVGKRFDDRFVFICAVLRPDRRVCRSRRKPN
jgi:hypothetical protein